MSRRTLVELMGNAWILARDERSAGVILGILPLL